MTCPGSTVKLRSSTATLLPKRLVRLRTSIKRPASSYRRCAPCRAPTVALVATGPRASAPSRERCAQPPPRAAALRPQVADLAVEFGERPRVVDDQVGDRQPVVPGWPAPSSSPAPARSSCRAAWSAGQAACALAHRPRPRGHSRGRARSPRAAARHGRRSRPAPRSRSSSCIRCPTSGCTIPFSVASFAGSAKTISPSRSRSSASVGPQHLGRRTPRPRPRAPASLARPPPCAMASASIRIAPCAASRRDTSLLPDPIPPVSPTRNMQQP